MRSVDTKHDRVTNMDLKAGTKVTFVRVAPAGERIPLARAFVAFISIACGGSSGAAGSPAPTGALAHDTEVLQGRTLFAANSATCHGSAGGGGLGPKFTGGKLQRDFPKIDAQIAFVKRGRGIMPAWGTSSPKHKSTPSYATNAKSSPTRTTGSAKSSALLLLQLAPTSEGSA